MGETEFTVQASFGRGARAGMDPSFRWDDGVLRLTAFQSSSQRKLGSSVFHLLKSGQLAVALLVLPRIQLSPSIYAGFVGPLNCVKHLRNTEE